jgi:anti-sigma B factor antagonist
VDHTPEQTAEIDGAAPLTVAVICETPGTELVRLAGELDRSCTPTLARTLAEVLARRPARLIVDLSGVRFADSSAIALWVRWAAAVDEFELRHPTPLLRTVLTRMGLADKLGITP